MRCKHVLHSSAYSSHTHNNSLAKSMALIRKKTFCHSVLWRLGQQQSGRLQPDMDKTMDMSLSQSVLGQKSIDDLYGADKAYSRGIRWFARRRRRYAVIGRIRPKTAIQVFLTISRKEITSSFYWNSDDDGTLVHSR